MRTHALARAGLLAGLVTGVASCLPSPCVIDDDCPVGAYCKGATVVRTADGEVDDEKSTDGACSFGSNPDGTSSSSGGGGSSGVTGGSSGVTGGSSGVTGGSSGVSNGSSTMSGSSGVSGATSTPVGSSSSTTTGGTSVGSGGSSATNSSGVSGASSVDSSSGGGVSSGSVGQSSSVAGTSSGVVGSSSVGGGSSSGVLTSSSVGAGSSSSSGAPPLNVTPVVRTNTTTLVPNQSGVYRAAVEITKGPGEARNYFYPTAPPTVEFRIGATVITTVVLEVPITVSCPGCSAAGAVERFTLPFKTEPSLNTFGSQVTVNLIIPYGFSDNTVDGTITATSPPMDVLHAPTITNVSFLPAAAPSRDCPKVCFRVGQVEKPVDLRMQLVDTLNATAVKPAIQANGGTEVNIRGLNGLAPNSAGPDYCYSVNMPLSVGRNSNANFNPRFHWQLGPASGVINTTPTPGVTSGGRPSCGSDFDAPLFAEVFGNMNGSGAVADFDRDGNLDMVAAFPGATMGQQVVISRGVGGGAFRGRFPISSNTLLGSVDIFLLTGDFDNDGLVDIVAIDVDSTQANVRFFQNQGTGFQFRPPTTTSLGAGVLGAAIRTAVATNLNADNLPDIAVAGVGGDGVTLLGNAGSGAFNPVTTLAGAPVRDLALGDITGDGQDDVFVLRNSTPNTIVIVPSGNTLSAGNVRTILAYTATSTEDIQRISVMSRPANGGVVLAMAYVDTGAGGGLRTRALQHNNNFTFSYGSYPVSGPMASDVALSLTGAPAGSLTAGDGLLIVTGGSSPGVYFRPDINNAAPATVVTQAVDRVFAMADLDFDGVQDLVGRFGVNPSYAGAMRLSAGTNTVNATQAYRSGGAGGGAISRLLVGQFDTAGIQAVTWGQPSTNVVFWSNLNNGTQRTFTIGSSTVDMEMGKVLLNGRRQLAVAVPDRVVFYAADSSGLTQLTGTGGETTLPTGLNPAYSISVVPDPASGPDMLTVFGANGTAPTLRTYNISAGTATNWAAPQQGSHAPSGLTSTAMVRTVFLPSLNVVGLASGFATGQTDLPAYLDLAGTFGTGRVTPNSNPARLYTDVVAIPGAGLVSYTFQDANRQAIFGVGPVVQSSTPAPLEGPLNLPSDSAPRTRGVDVNLDGSGELLVQSKNAIQIRVHGMGGPNDYTTGFQVGVPGDGSPAAQPVLADVNGDAVPDLVVASNLGTGGYEVYVVYGR